MSNRQKGMVLITTIIMIVILTMLVLTLMQAVFLYIKVNNQVVKKHETLYQLEAVARKLMMAKIEPNCILPEEDPNQMVRKLLHHEGCSIIDNNHQYHYVIGDLCVFPCLHIVSETGIYSSHHWLLSVATEPPRQDILQLRIAKSERASACNTEEEHQINPGVISWRHLPYTVNN